MTGSEMILPGSTIPNYVCTAGYLETTFYLLKEKSQKIVVTSTFRNIATWEYKP